MNSRPRILFAGYEIGAQMQLMASTFRDMGYVSHALAFNSDFRNYHTDFHISHQRMPFKRVNFLLRAIRHYDIFHFFWGVSLLDWWRFYGIDLPLLRLAGKKIIVHFRGTDVMNINRFGADGENTSVPLSDERQLRKLAWWQRFAHRILVSTPNLLPIVGDDALVVPQVIDSRVWVPEPSIPSEYVTVVHAPTRRNIKGTDQVLAAVNDLEASGHRVRLRLLENLSYNLIQQEMVRSDIGVDQLVLGWYGKAAVELMALGKPVICYIAPELRHFAPDLPIISATKETLTSRLEELLLSRSLRERMGQRGVDYVRANHDCKRVASQLVNIYRDL